MDAKFDVRMFTLDPNAIRDLLKMYKNYPCLWDQTDLLYCNKDARKEAYEAILKKMKTYHEDITMDICKRKLENMRATYKREVRRMMAATQRGDSYRTTLWYFDLFSFIDGGTVVSRNYKESRDGADDDDNDETQPDIDNDEPHAEPEFSPYYAEYLDEEPTSKKSKKSDSYISKRVKEEETNPNISGVFLTGPDPEEPIVFNEINEAVAFGRAVGLQLKELDGLQRVIAEKLISDTIFHARLNKLTTNSTIHLNSDFGNI
ncbi:uncharacterized protein LOC112049268 [Bicyclus anynana]|uniref:Uncharacterized protein LOC112049268 n=1 Tax=Bicyclus anynana TaxID=110368 RepID=A0A6J1NCW3_BICAN|nr:uncharacterized protein LOC112049268 [Bicyclus anynana]